MSDSSEEEDLSRFREVVDTSFVQMKQTGNENSALTTVSVDNTLKSERYLEVASHYSDVKVPMELQKRIGAKVSAVIGKKVEFVESETKKPKKQKAYDSVKLFKNSTNSLTCEEAEDTFTKLHNEQSKKFKRCPRTTTNESELSENEKINAVVVNGNDIMQGNDTRLWKSRRKEKIFRYKSSKNSKVLTALEDRLACSNVGT